MTSLLQGKTFGVVALAGPVRSAELVERVCSRAASLGWRLKGIESLLPSDKMLAAPDDVRLQGLYEMVLDASVDIIWCVRGGYGAVRLLPLLDFELLATCTKPLVGFSDITALQCGLLAKADTHPDLFHGPMMMSLLGASSVCASSLQQFESVLAGTVRSLEIPGQGWQEGVCEGPIVGGNITVLASLVGTGYLPDFVGKILLLEDVNEPRYRLDRCLQQLYLSGSLEGVVGVVCGDLGSDSAQEDRAWLLKEYFHDASLPVLATNVIGHCASNYTIPIGVPVRMEVERGRGIVTGL